MSVHLSNIKSEKISLYEKGVSEMKRNELEKTKSLRVDRLKDFGIIEEVDKESPDTEKRFSFSNGNIASKYENIVMESKKKDLVKTNSIRNTTLQLFGLADAEKSNGVSVSEKAKQFAKK